MKVLYTILALAALCMMVLAKTQRVGDECNWSKNCQQYADGVGPAWAGGRITCAVPQDHSPDSCGSGNDNRNNFYGLSELCLLPNTAANAASTKVTAPKLPPSTASSGPRTGWPTPGQRSATNRPRTLVNSFRTPSLLAPSTPSSYRRP
ncbi:hypothetical protein PaG_03764 [Moesziomyces aphidis]|uniref:Secreted protein n=1 Tax=Moesziomyces aphidis TaxID=84754 RepID=W3VKW8_MOEAP|nr:hypothetical protein PaG_03764 [Moesziomyces aphidis]